MATLLCQSGTIISAPSTGVSAAQLKRFAYSKQWLDIVHYSPSLSRLSYVSSVADTKFFAADNGRNNPLAELKANIAAFNGGQPELACRFPARFSLLYSQSMLQSPGNWLKNCEEYQVWKTTINPGSITLVFPAAYLNSPSSMFGHTLLRIDPKDQRKDMPLVAYALNYAANVAPGENNVLFAFKGIFGNIS